MSLIGRHKICLLQLILSSICIHLVSTDAFATFAKSLGNPAQTTKSKNSASWARKEIRVSLPRFLISCKEERLNQQHLKRLFLFSCTNGTISYGDFVVELDLNVLQLDHPPENLCEASLTRVDVDYKNLSSHNTSSLRFGT